jgi:hypothetical protein
VTKKKTVRRKTKRETADGTVDEVEEVEAAPGTLDEFAEWFYSEGCRLNPTEVRSGVGMKLEEMGIVSPEHAERLAIRNEKREQYPFSEGAALPGDPAAPKPVVEGDDLR